MDAIKWGIDIIKNNLDNYYYNGDMLIQDNLKANLENNFLMANFKDMKIKKVQNIIESWW